MSLFYSLILSLSRLPYERNKKFHPGIRASLRIIYRASYQQPLNLKTLTLQAILLFTLFNFQFLCVTVLTLKKNSLEFSYIGTTLHTVTKLPPEESVKICSNLAL